MRKFTKNVTSVLAIAWLIVFMGCGASDDDDKKGGTYTPRYKTVPYSKIPLSKSAASKSAAPNYEVMLSAYDNTYYYYVLYLGYVERVPVLFRDAVSWTGSPAAGLTVGFSREEADEKMVSNSITTAITETVSKEQEVNYSVAVELEANAKAGLFGTGAGWRAQLGVTAGGSTTWGSSTERSRESTSETALTKSTGSSDSLEFTITGDDPHGKYRYTLFGTTDVYMVVQIKTSKQSMDDITDYYVSFCARPATYAWGVDYEPNQNGTFKKNVDSELLELPNIDVENLEVPTTKVSDAAIPKPAQPTADPAGGSYYGDIDVKLSSANSDSKIYYTTDTSTPNASSALYTDTSPIKIKKSCTLKAVAIKEGSPDSDVMTENYTITPGRQRDWYYNWAYTLSRAEGGSVTKVQGDSEIGSSSGKNIDWDIQVDLRPSGNNVVASFTYQVREKGGDNSILKLTQDITIPLNKNDIQIDYPYNNYYRSGTISGKQHEFVRIYPESPVGGPLYNLLVKIDGSGNDEGNIAVMVGLGFNYTYQP